MEVLQHHNPATFADRARSFLIQRECENCGLIGMSGALASNTLSPETDPLRLMFTVEANGEVIGLSAQTRPHTMLVSRMAPDAANALAKTLHEIGWAGCGFNGPAESSDAIAICWCALSGKSKWLQVSTRVFQLTRVIPLPPVSGEMVVATHEHIQLINRWRDEFAEEIGEPNTSPSRSARQLIADKRVFLWIDQKPRAMTGVAGPTPSGIRINAVYTSPQFRSHGYASNLVAAVSNYQLQLGKRFCFLFTDIANPTSNKIYQQIGYQPICDFRHWTFVD